MSAESIFDPIPIERIREARARLALDGESVDDWARRNGYEAKTVYSVLSGKRMAIRGLSLQIAIKLGLRPAPGPVATPQHPLPDPSSAVPSVAQGVSTPDQNRRPISQLGEAAR